MAESIRKRSGALELGDRSRAGDGGSSSASVGLFHRPRANNLKEIDAQAVRSRYLHHRGSVRGTFATETPSRFSQRVWKVINGIGGSRKDYSLFLFHKNTKFRKNVKRIAKSKVFKLLMGVLVLLHSVTLCLYQPAINRDDHYVNDVIYYVTIMVVVLYILEAGLNIIAYGLIQTKKAYLRNAAHILDIVVILLGILYIAIANVSPIIGEVFASLMGFKLIKLIALSKTVRFILKALAKSIAPLFYLFILTFLVISFLALIGIQLFNGSLHGGCYSSYYTPAGINRSILVSEFPCARNLDANQSVPPGSHKCPYGSTCLEWPEGPLRGVISLDHMGSAYLVVFQVISLEGWVGILYLYEAALGYEWVWSYFVVVMFFGSIFILNLWTGVLTSVFLGVNEREEEYGKNRKLKEKQRITTDLQNYNDWLKIAAEMDAPSDTGSIIDRGHDFFVWNDPFGEESDEETDSEEENAENDMARGSRKRARVLWHQLRKRVRKTVRHKFFLWFVLTLRAINLILLMSLHFPSEEIFNTVIFSLNYVFSVLYLAEFLLRVFSLSKRKYLYYWRNVLHFFEILLSILTVLELVVFPGIPLVRDFHLSIFINAVWCLKLILFVKHTRSWEGMREILATVFQLLPSVLSLIGIVSISLFVYTILGMRLFGERLSNTGFVEPNFDNLFKSFLLVFQLMTSEDWNSLLFTSLDHWINVEGMLVGGLVTIYFVIGVAFGTFFLLSLCLAVSVDKLSEVRSLRSDSAEQQEKTEKQRNERKQHISELKKEPQVKRRTLRLAMKYVTGTSVEPSSVKQQKKKRGFSLRLRRSSSDTWDSKSSASPRSESIGSPIEGSEVSSSSQNESPVKRSKKRPNPLRLVKRQKSEFFEQQKSRVVAIDSHAGTGGESSLKGPHKKVSANLSFDSAQEQYDIGQSSPSPYTRSQSSPADTPSTFPGASFREYPKLDPIEEVHGLTDNENSGDIRQLRQQNSMITSPENPRYPPYLSDVDDPLSNALFRGNSLTDFTDFTPISENSKRMSSKRKTAAKVVEKVWQAFKWVKDYVGTIQLNPKKELLEIPCHSSFFILSPDNRLREWCYRVVSSKAFSTITYVTVLISSLVLTVEVPVGVDVEETSTQLCSLQSVVIFLDCFIMGYFFLEMVLKMIALGVVLHKGSYLRGLFNILDFFILVSNVIPIVVYFSLQLPENPSRCIAYSYYEELSAVSVLRVFRVLRPLRAIRIGGLYLVVTGLVSSIKSMGSIFFMTGLVLLVFSVSGVHIFRGQFWYCTDPVMTQEETCRGQYYGYEYTLTGGAQFPGLPCPQEEDRMWLRRGLNFDNVGFAILTLYSMLTIEGWQNTMYAGLNSFPPLDSKTAVGQIPGSTQTPVSAVYFIIYMVVMALILVQLFTGFVIVTFQEDGVKSFREAKLDRNQRNCLYFALTAKPLRQYVPKFELHRRFHTAMLPIVNHVITKFIIATALVINCILLACVTYQGEFNMIIYYINIFFTVFFTLEAVIKIVVFTPPTYFRSVENVFEFLIVIGSIIELTVQLFATLDPQYEQSHIASSFRVLRLVTFVPSVRLILWTVIKSLEIFPWVGFLLLIVFFMYTVIGMQVFGDIRRAPIDELTPTREITEYNNFANFPQALLLMIRMATGENWQDIMLSCLPEQLCERKNGTECGNNFAYFFFPSFYFISSIIILNLLVAIVIDNFDYILRDKATLGAHQLDLFVKLWSLYDREAKGVLPSKSVLGLMRECNPPVGWGRLCPEPQAYRKMIQMNMPLKDKENSLVSFNATLFALVRNSLEIQCSGCPDCTRRCNIDLRNRLKILFPTMPIKKIDEVLPYENDPTVGEEYAALLVQRIWRAYIMRRRKVLEIFHESKRVLKAGLRSVPDAGPDLLQRHTSDFEIELPPAPPRRASEVTNASTERSPSTFSTNFFTVDVEPSYPGRLYSPNPQTPTEPAARVTPSSLNEPFAPAEGRFSQVSPDPIVTAGHIREPHDGLRHNSTADNMSELSFTSAYSNPVGDHNDDYEKIRETTV